MPRVLVAALVLVLAVPAAAQAPAPAPLVDWIRSLQTLAPGRPADGAVAMRPDPGFYLDGQPYRHVVPYFAHLAVTALLDAAPSPDALALAERHVAWTIAHVGPRGVPPEAWVAPSGDVVTCPAQLPTLPSVPKCDHVDATDSAAATFLDLVRAYAQAGGDPDALDAWAPAVRAAGATLRGLQDDADGLTWAKADYRVKYLMDNAETVRGFLALAELERLWGNPVAAEQATRRAHHASAGLTSLRDSGTGLYAWARQATDEATDLGRWYADGVAQAWPVLFGAVPARHSGRALRALDASYDGAPFADWATDTPDPGGFAWPAVGVAAALAGETDRARLQVESLWGRVVVPASGAPFPGPFHVADAGWLLRAVVLTGNPPLSAAVARR